MDSKEALLQTLGKLGINKFTKEDLDRIEQIESENEGKVKADEGRASQEVINKQLSAFPARFRDSTFDNYILSDNEQSRAKQVGLIKQLKSGNSVVMYGNNGTGKTHLAFASLRHQILLGKFCKYILAPELYDEVKNSFNTNSTQRVISEYSSYDYLVVDEVDKSFGSATEFISLYRIINRRYENLLPTVLITNAGKEVLVDVIGNSSFERVTEFPGGKLFMDWESHRRKR